MHIPLMMKLRGFISLRDVGPKSLTSQQVMVILLLSKHPEISLTELAQRSKVTHGTMVIAVQKLVKKGLLKKKKNPSDGRSVLLALTPKGAEIPSGIQKEMIRKYKALCDSLPETKVSRLTQAMELIMEVFSNE
jgi:DNA-binding MarR family transcriptional regulator